MNNPEDSHFVTLLRQDFPFINTKLLLTYKVLGLCGLLEHRDLAIVNYSYDSRDLFATQFSCFNVCNFIFIAEYKCKGAVEFTKRSYIKYQIQCYTDLFRTHRQHR